MRLMPNEILGRQAEELIREGQTVRMRFMGHSMMPYLRPGVDTVVLAPVSEGELQPGTIVFFCYNGHYMVHRIVARGDGRLIIQGDGNVKGREEIDAAGAIAVLRSVVRPSGRVASPDSLFARAYWAVWRTLHPLRGYILAAHRRTVGRKYYEV